MSVIAINNTSGKPILLIRGTGELVPAEPNGRALNIDGPITDRFLRALGFDEEYTRASVTNGKVKVYRRNDGQRLRRHEEAGKVWWDTGETLNKPADIDLVRKEQRGAGRRAPGGRDRRDPRREGAVA